MCVAPINAFLSNFKWHIINFFWKSTTTPSISYTKSVCHDSDPLLENQVELQYLRTPDSGNDIIPTSLAIENHFIYTANNIDCIG